MSGHAATLRTMAKEFDGLVTALTEQARMAANNGQNPTLTRAMAKGHADTAERFSHAAGHYQARAEACRAAVEALATRTTEHAQVAS